MSVRARAAARRFVLATLLALGAGEARAAVVCSDTPGPNDRIYCARAVFTNVDIGIDLTNRAIATSGANQLGVYAFQRGSGAISIGMTGGSIATTGASSSSISGYINQSANEAALAIGMTRGSVNTSGLRSRGIYGVHTGTGRIAIGMTNSSISTTGGRAHGIEGYHTGAGGVDIAMRGGSVMATGEMAHGVYGIHTGAGGIDIDVRGGSIATTRASSRGITAWIANAANEAALAIGMTRGSVATSGSRSHGINGVHAGAGGVDIAMRGGSVMTTGERAHGVYGLNYSGAAGGIDIDVTGGSVMATGERAHGVYGVHAGAGGIDIDMTGGTVTAVSQSAYGIQGFIHNAANEAAISIDVTGGTVVGEGLFGYGAYGAHDGLGSVSLTTGAEAEVKAPFSIGVGGRLANAANAAGRLVITHGGAVEARNIGLQAWATRSRGHTFGAGAQTADGPARTAPMIAVASSGTVTVGASVTDAFVRDRIAGADETLSAAESAVLDAVAAGDSDALDTALAALPAAYDAAWKAEARNLLGKLKLTAAPSAATAAGWAADEILGLSRAGVRAAALSHRRIATFVRQGDRDPAILATAAGDRTEQQRAALAEQEMLSAAERTVLAAILTGGDLTAALAALPTSAAYAYTDAWKDGVRQRAASYNDGGIRVDVTGGSIAAEGNGVEAFYAVPHDRNGAITVAVAEGARVTGSRNGIHVRGAGAGEGSFRAQSVTVNGAVTGGTGAGVHLAGGGRLTVGATGEVGATSGVGVLADGAGDSSMTVAGTVTGDVLGRGAGEHTVTVSKGGTVTGDVRSEGGGDLSASVSGTVDGDVRAEDGGALRLDVREGGAVTGTVHDPAGLLTVAGRIGRLLYTSGGMVTVAATGRLTGVEVEGRREALRSEAGDLAFTVAGMGTVTGDVRSMGDGDLTATVAGTVTGDVRSEGGGDLSASVSGTVDGDVRAEDGGALRLDVREGGAVTGTVHDPASPLAVAGTIGRLLYTSGATVTVGTTGRLTGVEVEGRREALRSEAGDLAFTVAGMGTVTGDVRSMGDGDLTATVAGTVTGDVRSEGGGDLSASVSGTVDGDVRAEDGGALRLDVREGGAVTGTVHDPASPLAVAGTIGRLLYTSGATVTVAATGRLTGVEVEGRREALRSEAGDLSLSVAGRVTGDVRAEGDGDLDATISGTLTGDLFGLGAGEHVVTVSEGGTVTGTVHLAASTVSVAGTAGRVLFDKGGTVTVGTTGSLTGIEVGGKAEAIRSEAGDLDVGVTAGGEVKGDLRALGDGDLDATISGTLTGDLFGLGAGEHVVTVSEGGTVTGTVHLAASTVSVAGRVGGDIDVAGAGSEVRVDGTVAGRIRFRRGGMVTVGRDGKVEGRVSRGEGKLVAVIERKPEETTRAAARERAFPGGIDLPDDEIRLRPELADHEPRMRVYEALPSVVLGMNGLRGVRERMAVPRSAKGGWARVERFQGKWKADASTSGKESGVGLRYRHRRHGVEVGLGGGLGEEARIGASLHHRRGTAKVSEGGDVELYGTGAGVSGTWTREEDYLDVQAAMTWYEADLTSSMRGVLRKDLSGHGHALGVEAGRRMALEHLPAGVVLTPRVGLVHSRVSMDAFSDVTGARVSVDDARSFKGRAGVDVETKPGGAAGSRVFASVEVEHEFSTDRKVRVSGTELKSEAEATWLRLGLNGVHTWDDGRYTVQGGVGYATSGGSHELGGGVSLNLRF